MAATYSDMNFALLVDEDGSVRVEEDENAINQSIKAILSTAIGERVNEPDFGSDIPNIIFEPMDEFTQDLMRNETKRAIQQWEDRVDVLDVYLEQDTDNSIYNLTVHYVILETGQAGYFQGRIRSMAG